MRHTPSATTIAVVSFVLFWLLVVGGTYLAGRLGARRWGAARHAWERLAAQWRPALVIALLFAAGVIVGQGWGGSALAGAALLSPAIFCEALVGLALARSLKSFEPLPVSRALRGRRHVWGQVGGMVLVALLVVLATLVASFLGTFVAHGLLHEPLPHTSGGALFHGNKWLTGFSLLSGAGIFEETLFRLVILSGVWRLTRSRWLAVVLAAAAFGAYHLTPLDSFYLVFWQHPWTQFFSSALSGVVLGAVYTWRGYETAVLGHTLSDWLPLVLLTA